MKYSPHKYQSYATRFIEEHPVSAVFLDMGLGKSVITLTAVFDLCLDYFTVRKVLVIAPLRVARDTWPDELRKWDHLNGLSYAVAVGSESERKAALRQSALVYIINRENVQWLIEESGLPFDYDMVVIDELSSFKSHQAKRFRSLLKVRPGVRRIVGLTGTPSSNGLMDLWAEFRVLDLGKRLGRFIGRYRETYFTPDKRNGQVVFSYKPLPGAEEAIYRQISDITISMKAVDHLEMPECLNNEVPVVLSEKEREIYDDMRQDLVISLKGEEIDAGNAAALANKLSQMANGAIYGEDQKVFRVHDRKLDALEDLIEAANGKPVLVAYWFRHDYERISERLHARHIPFSRLETSEDISPIQSEYVTTTRGEHPRKTEEKAMTEKTRTQIENMKNQTIGVEVEMNNITRRDAAKVAAEHFGTGRYEDTAYRNGYYTWSAWDAQGREWKFQRDVSIQGPDSERCELVTPILHYEDLPLLQELVRKLRKAKAKSDASRGCGVHIHIGANGHDAKTLRNLANIMASHENLIATALNIDHIRIARYCRTVNPEFLRRLNQAKPTTMAKLADIWYESNGAGYNRDAHYNDSRYHMLNLHATFTKGTIEFRLFQFDEPGNGRKGGLHAGQLKSYIQLCLALSQMAKDLKSASPKPQQTENPKYAMRTWLLRLGFIGDEFETARDFLTRRLPGDAAFRTERTA